MVQGVGLFRVKGSWGRCLGLESKRFRIICDLSTVESFRVQYVSCLSVWR